MNIIAILLGMAFYGLMTYAAWFIPPKVFAERLLSGLPPEPPPVTLVDKLLGREPPPPFFLIEWRRTEITSGWTLWSLRISHIVITIALILYILGVLR
jgi:hypothetical protein